MRLQGRELGLLWPAVTLPQAERSGVDGVRVQLEGRGLEGAVEGSVGVLRQVQVWLRSVIMTTDTLFQDGRCLPVILHDNLRSKQQSDMSKNLS